jgi:hypothetical protein
MNKDKMDIEKLFNTQGDNDLLKGDWYIIQWIPDGVAGERISVGVLFINNNRMEHEYKFLGNGKQIGFFNPVYGHKASFHIRLAIDIAKDIIEDEKKITYISIEREMINLRIGYGGYASGNSYEEIVNRLFDDIVKKPNMG